MILLVVAAWIGLTLAEKRTERHGISKDSLNNLAFYSILAFIIGGRITFALQNISAFIKSPLGIFSINPDLFDVSGGLAAAIIVFLILCQRQSLTAWSALDALTPFFSVLAIGLGLSHLAAGTAFGLETDKPWAIELWNAYRHPTQMYETLASLLILGLLLLKKQNTPPGIFFLTFCVLTAGAHVFLGAFRADQDLILNGIKQGQFLSWIILFASFVFIEFRYRAKRASQNNKA
jgi:phosphatidylglycerol:prolipoprotein diacylglycerol transferase